MVNFSKPYPFKGATASYVFLFWLDSSSKHCVSSKWDSSSTESTRSETQRQLSPFGVRLHVKWVNAEGANIYKDFVTLRWLSWHGVSLHFDQLTWILTWRWLNWRGITPCHLSPCRVLKNLNKSANSRTKSKTFNSLIIWPIYDWSVQKLEKNLMELNL